MTLKVNSQKYVLEILAYVYCLAPIKGRRWKKKIIGSIFGELKWDFGKEDTLTTKVDADIFETVPQEY